MDWTEWLAWSFGFGKGWLGITSAEAEARVPSFGGMRAYADPGTTRALGYRREESVSEGDIWMQRSGTGWRRASPPGEERFAAHWRALRGEEKPLRSPETAFHPLDPGRVPPSREPTGGPFVTPAAGAWRDPELEIVARQEYLAALEEARLGFPFGHQVAFGLWDYGKGEPRRRIRAGGELKPWWHARVDEMATEFGYSSGEEFLDAVRQFVQLEAQIRETKGEIGTLARALGVPAAPFPGPPLPEEPLDLPLAPREVRQLWRLRAAGAQLQAQFGVGPGAEPLITPRDKFEAWLAGRGYARLPAGAERGGYPALPAGFEARPYLALPAVAGGGRRIPPTPPGVPPVAAEPPFAGRPREYVSAEQWRELVGRGRVVGGRLQIPLEPFTKEEVSQLQAAAYGLSEYASRVGEGLSATEKLTSSQKEASRQLDRWAETIRAAEERFGPLRLLGEGVPPEVQRALGRGLPAAAGWEAMRGQFEEQRLERVMQQAAGIGGPPGAGGVPGGPGGGAGGAPGGPWDWLGGRRARWLLGTGYGLWAAQRMLRLTAGAVSGWIGAYGQQQLAEAAGLYQMGLGAPVVPTAPLEIMQAQAALQQAQVNLGQGAYGVWRPAIRTIADVGIGPGVGAVVGGLLPSAGLAGLGMLAGAGAPVVAGLAALPLLALGGAYTYQQVQQRGGLEQMLIAGARAIQQQGPVGPPVTGGFGGGGGAGGVGPGAAMSMQQIVDSVAQAAGVAPSDVWQRATAFMTTTGRLPTRQELRQDVQMGIMGQDISALTMQAGGYLGMLPTQMEPLYQYMGGMGYQQAQLFLGQLQRAAPVMGRMREVWGLPWQQQLQVAGLPEPQQYRLGAAMAGQPWALSWLAQQRAQQIRQRQPTLPLLPTLAVAGYQAPISGFMEAQRYELLGEALDPYAQMRREWAIQDQMRAVQRQYRDVGLGAKFQQLQAQRAYWGRVWPLEEQLTGLAYRERLGAFDYAAAQAQVGYRQAQAGFAFQEAQSRLGYRQFIEGWQLNLRQFELGTGYQRERQQQAWQMGLLQRGWTREDWETEAGTAALTFGWRMEDLSRGIRYARGPERAQLMRQREREETLEVLRREQFDKQRQRQDEIWSFEDKRHSEELKYARESEDLQREQIELSKTHYEERKKLSDDYQRKVRGFYEEGHALSEANRERQKQFYQEGFELQQQLTQEQRAWAEEQAKFEEARLGRQAEYNKRMDELDDSMTQVQRGYESLVAGVQKELQEGERGTIYGLTMGWLDDTKEGLETVGDLNRDLWRDFSDYIEDAQKKLKPYIPPPTMKPYEDPLVTEARNECLASGGTWDETTKKCTWKPMQEGGIVTRPTRALLAERGPEAVIPLERAGDLQLLGGKKGATLDDILRALKEVSAGVFQLANYLSIKLAIDGREVAYSIIPYVEDELLGQTYGR